MSIETCPSCGFDLQPNFKFCPGCGVNLQTKVETRQVTTAPGEIPLPPSTGITIEFPFSTSQSFDFAVKEAAKHPSFMQFGEGKKAIHRVTYDPADMAAAVELVEYLRGWRRRIVYVDGRKVTWDSVFAFEWCFKEKQASFKPGFYCFGYENEWEFNIWGCIHTRLAFREDAEWFCWGRFLNDRGDWRFDKERIRHELEKNLHPYRFCPALDGARLNEVLNAFPEQVNPKKDKNWKFVERWGDEGGPGLVMTVTRYGFTEKVVMKSVSPSGLGALREMGKRLKFRLPPWG